MADGMLHTVSLDDKYTVAEGRILLTGTQAIVRLMLVSVDATRRERVEFIAQQRAAESAD